jgi:peroxiredoxin Q/BCP
MSLAIGKPAPDFTLPSTGGEITLSSFRGKPVVLYFYPKDDTPGCTKESCEFRDNLAALKKLNVQVLGLSKDSIKSHEKFAEKYDLNFPLISDPEAKTIKEYGSWGEKTMMGKKYMGTVRSTFLIDADGKLAHIWRDVNVNGHVAEVTNEIKKLKN